MRTHKLAHTHMYTARLLDCIKQLAATSKNHDYENISESSL